MQAFQTLSRFTNQALQDLTGPLPPFRRDELLTGLSSALTGLISSAKNHNVRIHYKDLLGSYATAVAVLYAGVGLFMATLLPVWFLFPGFAITLLTLIPTFSFIIAKKRHPLQNIRLFLDELRALSATEAEDFKKEVANVKMFDPRWLTQLRNDIVNSWHFMKWSVAFFLVAFIPFVGSAISLVGNTWLISDKLAWNLLLPYLSDIKHMNYYQQIKWIREKRWYIIGFVVPFTALAAIPLVGPIILGLGQAAIAHLIYNVTKQETAQANPPPTAPHPSAAQ